MPRTWRLDPWRPRGETGESVLARTHERRTDARPALDERGDDDGVDHVRHALRLRPGGLSPVASDEERDVGADDDAGVERDAERLAQIRCADPVDDVPRDRVGERRAMRAIAEQRERVVVAMDLIDDER